MEYDHEGKPCRACSDFKSWMKIGKQQNVNKEAVKNQQETSKSSTQPCPPDVNEIGTGSWTLLHTMSVYLPQTELSKQQKSDVGQFMSILSRTYPCNHCAEDLKKDLKDDPPKVQTGKDYAQWLCQLHNKVNVKLGKPTFDCSKVYERWRDGYPDGSCD